MLDLTHQYRKTSSAASDEDDSSDEDEGTGFDGEETDSGGAQLSPALVVQALQEGTLDYEAFYELLSSGQVDVGILAQLEQLMEPQLSDDDDDAPDLQEPQEEGDEPVFFSASDDDDDDDYDSCGA